MRVTGRTDKPEGGAEGRTHAAMAALTMPRWIPDMGDGWILIVYVGGKAIYLRDELPLLEATEWEEDGSCLRCGRYREDHLIEGQRFFCRGVSS